MRCYFVLRKLFTEACLYSGWYRLVSVASINCGTLCTIILVSTFSNIGYAQQVQREATAIYSEFCSVCHGEKGDGDSRARMGLVPPPRDFTSPQTATVLTRSRMIKSVTEGVPGTAMTAWSTQLNSAEIAAVVDMIRDKFLFVPTAETATRGSKIFADFCSVCHGEQGSGAMWAMAGLSPPPANFTAEDVQQKLTRERMIRSVTFGIAETAMVGWKDRLNASEVEAVVDYVRSEIMQLANAEETGSSEAAAATVNDMSAPLPDKLIGNRHEGGRLYYSNCSMCHGETGDGRGPRAYFINPKPRNFIHAASRATLNRPELYTAIAKGRLYSEMPAWDKVLEPQQIADIAEYVFTQFIEPEETQ